MKKTRYTSKDKIKLGLMKMKGLFSDKPSCLHVEFNGKRMSGSEFSDCEISEDGLSFSYAGKKFSFSMDNLYLMKRLRTRRYCFFASGQTAQKKVEAKATESSEEVSESKSRKRNKKKTV